MTSTLLSFVLRLTQLISIECASAADLNSLTVSTWSYGTTYQKMFESILNVLVGAAPVVAGAVFVAGAFMLSISAGKEDLASKGKGLMIDALIGFAVAVGALGVVKTTAFFIWGH